ncbi:MAG: DNA polymerase I, partial [Candidatus Aureabacteria bacterium]|nr:DNA polymerase I [Candidatus Auribacterota bacterium]
ELRLLAHLSKDKKLLDAFKRGKDIHTQTASLIFHIPEDHVTLSCRTQAKAINFGIIYGMGPRKLSMDTGIPYLEANAFINEYFLSHPKVKSFIEGLKESTRDTQLSRTIMGRLRHLSDINSSQPRIRSAAENMAVNTPIQGSAADIIKIAMIRIDRSFQRLGLKSRMLLQVHDELIFEVPEEEIEKSRDVIQKEMSEAVKIDIPLEVKLSQGRNWLEAE